MKIFKSSGAALVAAGLLVSVALADNDRAKKDLPGERIANELANINLVSSSSYKKVHMARAYDWSAVEGIHIREVAFDLDPEFFDPLRYDRDIRTFVNASLDEKDKSFLQERFTRELSRDLDNMAPIVSSNAIAPETIVVEPIITFVTRSVSGADQLTRRPNLSFASSGAGEFAARVNLRDASGHLIGSVFFQDQTSFLDTVGRTSEWVDVERLMDQMSRIVKNAVKSEVKRDRRRT